MKNLRTILSLFLIAASLTMAHADGVVIRYVRTTGAYKNGGTSWSDAKNNIQDAINAVRDAMQREGATEGRVYVAAGTYTPTESTEARGASQYQAFKLYAGITLYGGFNEADPESTPEARTKVADNTLGTSYMVNQTILSGNLTSRQAKFAYNTNKHTFSTSFYGNVYHVVWFATEGFTGTQAKELTSQACVDGCVITGGNANNTSLIEHTHRAYGGGVYMVQNSVLRNCEIYHCAASRDGGAIYMDGGGQVEQCFVHDNQATGLGVQYGQGGGIAIEGNGRVVRSAVLNNVGRLGGGISMTGATGQSRAVLATLVAHNNALIEAGGIYMADGGLVNNVTVVRNACYGTGITQNGMVTGRSAGIYVRNQGTLYNTVMWGGSCTRNNNVQYAFSRSSSGNAATLNHIGVENADRCNWSGTSRQNVHNLSADNTGINPSVNYPAFATPHATQGVISTSHSTQEDPRVSLDYGTGNNWAPQATSFIATIGVLQKSPAYSSTDILGQAFAVKCALGAYKAMQQQVGGEAHMEVPYQSGDFADRDLTPDTNDNNTPKVATVYVDPSATSMGDGTSWDSPYPDLLTAMAFFRDHGKIENAQVFVKEGTLTTANSNSTEEDIRQTTIHMYRGTRVYGGFPASLEGTDKEGRNPVKYITLLSGNVDGTGYDNNAHHLVTYETSAHNTVLDGFQFRYGNAAGATDNCGAALYIHDNSDTSNTNVHHVRNCVLAGNTAQHGAAVYLSAGTHFTFENCIFHNNEVTDHAANGGDIDCGVVHVNAGAEAIFDHCNFIRNVGHGLSVQGTATVNSSVFYANLKDAADDTRGTARDARLNGILTNGDGAVHGTVSGSGNLYDCHDTNAVNGSAILTYAKDGSATYPLFVNPTRNAGVSPAGDITTYGRATDWMPMNMNPMVNALDSDGAHTDITLSTPRTYGGRADIGAVENRKCETYPDGQPASGAILYVRDYRNEDGTIDLTKGGDGLSWATAINGNAVYKLTSTEQGKESQTTVSAKDYAGSTFVDGNFTKNETKPEYNEGFARILKNFSQVERIDYTSAPVDGLTAYIAGARTNNINYLKEKNNGTLIRTQDAQEAILFTLEAVGDNYKIKSGSKYLTYNSDRVKFTDDSNAAATWTITQDTNNTWSYYISLSSDGSKGWNFYQGENGELTNWSKGSGEDFRWEFLTPEQALNFGNSGDNYNGYLNKNNKADDGTPEVFFDHNYQYTSGLQYAVNKARLLNIDLKAQNAGVVPDSIEVWVASGSYFDGKGYKMQDGVNVFSGFDELAIKAGASPAKIERQPRRYETTIQVREVDCISTSDKYYRGAWEDVKNAVSYDNTVQYDWFRVLTQPRSLNGGVSGLTTGGSYNIYFDGTTYNPLISHPDHIAKVKEGATFKHVTKWDGFIIQGGFFSSKQGDEAGGGAQIRCNGQLENCEIRYNLSRSQRGGGVGVRVGDLIGSSVHDNYNEKLNGGGVCASRHGTIYNSVIYDNDCSTEGSGSQAYIDNAYFYNNTIASTGTKTLAQNSFFAFGDNAYLLGSTFINNIVWPYSGSDANHVDTSKTIDVNKGNLTVKNNCLPSTVRVGTAGNNHDNHGGVTAYPNFVDPANGNFALLSNSNCINAGLEVPYYYQTAVQGDTGFAGNTDSRPVFVTKENALTTTFSTELPTTDITLPGTDIVYADRIQDCAVDIGAYEFNGSYSITPQVVGEVASFFVTQNGRGKSSAADPANAACMQKLQKVLDAAGRYKYNNPTKQVIVKLAAIRDNSIKYYPCRTSAPNSANPREWSIMVPHGVELWGGYTDHYTNDAVNGFTAPRDVVNHPTYLGGDYIVERNQATAYHVVTFTDRIFDPEGNPYLLSETDRISRNEASTNNGSETGGAIETDDKKLCLMSSKSSNESPISRGVVDGCFIVGGQADGEAFANSTIAATNSNRYGAGALINEYGHVRNCIIEDNTGVSGAAVAIMPGGMVSGSLLRRNTATEQGGGVYVFPHDTKLALAGGVQATVSNESLSKGAVYTSTIVDNKAGNAGGGISFNNDASNAHPANALFNSVVVWNNQAPEGANVYGYTTPHYDAATETTIDVFPFAYSAVQDMRASGLNNMSVSSDNTKGVRFADPSTVEPTNPLYGLTFISVLQETGMPISDYQRLQTELGLAAADFTGTPRHSDGQPEMSNVEIGARAFALRRPTLTADNLLTRLYVSQPEDVDVPAAETLYASAHAIYGQQGSSFGYPFQNLQHALDYIYKARKSGLTGIANIDFEIYVSRGTYWPTRDLCATGLGNALGNTFLLPEGVALSGGYYTQEHSGTRHFYGQKGSSQPSETTIQAMVGDATRTVTIDHLATQAQRDTRKHEDVNANLISEPWEYEYQTILSGDAMNTDDHHVYHVLTVIPDASYVGELPAATATANDSYNVGTTCYETTQHPIYMDGLQILDGQAQTANKALFAAPGHASTQAYNYYHGGALMVDGNWLCTTVNGSVDYKHTGVGTSVGYRNIPVTIHNCIINSNRANYGGAISSNGDLLITQCSFAHNMAEAVTELVADGRNANYPGNGGALYVTKDVTAVNTVFANNEARKTDIDTAPSNGYVSYRVAEGGATTTTQSIFGGAGGAVMAGFNSYYNFVNCDFVRNKANMYPAIYTLRPQGVDSEHLNYSLNTAFWGNEANAANYAQASDKLKFASKLVANVSTWSEPTEGHHNYMPSSIADLDVCIPNAYFCGYEAGTNLTANNDKDCRQMQYTVGQILSTNIQNQYDHSTQNCNVTVSSSNTGTEGPNFTNPSLSAGYDGYMEAADWSFARINVLTDQGSGLLKQSWTGTDVVTFDNDQSTSKGIYNAFQAAHPTLLPIGETEYMRSLGGEDHLSSYRIAKDYSPSAQLAYIDIGVYEYPHIKLALDEGDEIDVLWVTTKEKTDNGPADGHTWQTPTSNLQLAMETLLASRNGHKKEIRLMEGEYAPMEQNYFSVDLSGIHPVLPTRWKQTLDQTEFYPQSLTIKGGYSQDLEGIYDPETYPATLVQNHGDNLFVVKDARLRFGDLELNASSTRVMPLQIDGVTFMNTTTNSTAGSALLYKSQNVASPEEVPTSYWDNDGLATGSVIPAKLTLSKCIFRQSTGQSIVKVEQDGGDLLIYNTLFADNTGVPLDADCTTKFINNTVAHNSAALKINRLGTSELPFEQNPNEEGDGEQLTQRQDGPFKVRSKALSGAALDLGTVLYNNVFWRNNSTSATTYGAQFTLTDESKNSDNVYSVPAVPAEPTADATDMDPVIKDRIQHNTITGLAYAYDSQRNRGLSNTNDDLANGPNFKDPDNTNPSLRDYHLNVSMTLINKGDDPLYDSNTYDISYYDHDYTVIGEEKYTDLDLAGRKRKVGHIDLGAYEFRDALERVLYVNPSPTHAGGDGSSWQTALQDVQNAINLAALYSDSNGAEAFVFVRGNSSQNMGRLTLRPGVNVYGSVTLLDEAPRLAFDDRTQDLTEKDRDLDLIRQYEAKVRTSRTGMATKTATTNSLIAGLTTEGSFGNSAHTNKYYLSTILDGFHITCPENALPTTEPIVNLTPASVGANDKHAVALRNAVIYGNTQAVAGKPLVKANDALLYNVLLVDNETSGTVHNGLIYLGANAYALGVTAVQNGMTKDDALTGDGTPSAVAARYVGCIYHNPADSPFVQHQVKAKSDPETTLFADTYHAKYQLADGQGSYIDALTAEQLKTAIPTKYYGATVANYGPDYYHPINLDVDLDLMSNPRVVGTAMDFGALETWTLTDTRVANTTQGATLTNSSWNGGGSALTYNGKSYDVMSFTVPNYPQEGSVIYLNKGASTSGTLSLDYALLPADYTLTPSYLLLQQGASLYGNGVGVQAVQVAVDKTLSPTGTIVALPYAINSITGSGTPACYEYSGKERSDWQYKFHASDSPAWNEVATAPFSSANNGILVTGINGTARIMGYGSNETAYVYTELRDAKSKSVTLTPYDDKQSSSGAADFTDKDNMGWNLIGLPYLVSEYKPYATSSTSGYTHTMDGISSEVSALHIPHTLWIYYNEVQDGESTGGNTAGYYSVPSWDSTKANWHMTSDTPATPAIWWGEGLFLQTAAKAETLTFYRPDCVDPAVTPVDPSTRRMTRYYEGELPEEDELTPLAPAFHTRKVTVRTGQLRVEVPTDATAVDVIDAQGRVRATTDTTTCLHLPNGVYVLRAK